MNQSVSEYYPEDLLKDYELLLEYFPSEKICRPVIISEIEEWKQAYSKDTGVTILEIGPGNGETTELLLSRVDCTMTLVEIDSTTSEALRKNLVRYEERIQIVYADAITWIEGQPDESLDVFTASWVLHNFPSTERDAFLVQVARVLKRGGLFIIFDKVLLDDEAKNEETFAIRMKRFEGLDDIGRSDLKTSMIQHELRDRNPPYVWHEKELIATLGALGLESQETVIRNEDDVVFTAIRK